MSFSISPERDKYFKHNRGFGGSSYLYLRDSADRSAVEQTLRGLKGVDEVISKREAMKRFHLMPERIGDLMVLGDSTTVFGDFDTDSEVLPDTYRSHGSLYEMKVPLFIYNGSYPLSPDFFSYNYKIACQQL